VGAFNSGGTCPRASRDGSGPLIREPVARWTAEISRGRPAERGGPGVPVVATCRVLRVGAPFLPFGESLRAREGSSGCGSM
jgi:hypothetical protein